MRPPISIPHVHRPPSHHHSQNPDGRAAVRYDLFAERLGFKLTWGCLFFYPHFYCLGVWAVLDGAAPANDISGAAAAAIAAVFLAGWCLTCGPGLRNRPSTAFSCSLPRHMG